MSDRLTKAIDWIRARALRLHEHFLVVERAVHAGRKLEHELKAVAGLIHNTVLTYRGGEMLLQASYKTLDKEWRNWLRGGRKDHECAEHVRRPEALLLNYKPGNGGHRAFPRALAKELQRRMTLVTGGRGKDGKTPLSAAFESMTLDFEKRRPLPGIDYEQYPVGAEFPWSYRTICRKKASKGLRALGNRGASAYKATAAYVSLNYSELRKGELYTLDDVRLDVTCMHEATGEMVGAVCYILMEVGSRAIVAYVIKPCTPDATSAVRRKSITEEDVAELLAYGLQAPGFGIGVGYVTHLLFERGHTACSDACQMMLEGVTDHGIKVHRTGMVGGVRWIGSARDKMIGNSTGKAVIESFNRQLHKLLLDLPGQRGNCAENEPQNMGTLGKSRYSFGASRTGSVTAAGGNRRQNSGTLIDEDEYLAQLNLATGGTMKFRLNNLYFRELEAKVREAIDRHNSEAGHSYRGHGTFEQVEVAKGVWRDRGGVISNQSEVVISEERPSESEGESGKGRHYPLSPSPSLPWSMGKREVGAYWGAWKRVEKVRPDLDRHAVTRRVLGCNVPHRDLTRAQWAKLLRAFAEIVRSKSESGSGEGGHFPPSPSLSTPEVDEPF